MYLCVLYSCTFFFFQAEDGIRDLTVTGVQTCALPIWVLAVPVHGKPSIVEALPGRLLRGLPERFTIGRYHSLYAERSRLPAVLSVVAGIGRAAGRGRG